MPRLWTSKPPLGTGINLAHPLAQGLVSAVPLNEAGCKFFTAAFTGGIATTRDTAGSITTAINPAWVITPYGWGIQFSGNWQIGNFLGSNAQPVTTRFSAAWLLLVPTPGSGANGVIGTGASGIEVRINASKINLLKATVADMGSSATSMSASTYYSGGVSYDGATARYYLNGNPDGTSSSAQTFNTQSFSVGGPGTSEVLQNGSILIYAYLWNRVLTPGEFQAIAASPYCFFGNQANRKRAAFVSGAPPAAQRGNIAYNQIRSSARQGTGNKFQMFGGGTPTAGHLAVYDANGNVVDGGASGGILPIRTVSAAATLTTADYTVVVIGTPLTITLPGSPPTGMLLNLKNGNTTAGQLITITTTGGILIDTSSTINLGATASLSIQFDGTQWRIL